MNSDNSAKALSWALVWSYVERWGGKIISLATIVVLARLLDPIDFGLVAFAKLFIDYFDSITGQGMGMALMQRKEISERHLSTAFWITASLGFALFVGVILAAPMIERLTSVNGSADILRALSVLILINSLSRVQVAMMSRENRFKELAGRGIAMSIVGGIVGIALAYSGYGVWSLVWQQIAYDVTAICLLWLSTTWYPKQMMDRESAKDLYTFASKRAIEQQVHFFSSKIDEIVISAALGVALLGHYSLAKRLAETLGDLFYGAPLVKVLVPAFSKLQDDLGALVAWLEWVTRLMAAASFPVFVVVAALSQHFVLAIFGEKWIGVSIPVGILMISSIFLLTPSILHSSFLALGKPGMPLKLNTIRAGLSVVLLSIGAIFGLAGVAIAVLLKNASGALLDYVSFRQVSRDGAWSCVALQARYLVYCVPAATTLLLLPYIFGVVGGAFASLMIYSLLGFSVYLGTLAVAKDPGLRALIRKVRGGRPNTSGDPS